MRGLVVVLALVSIDTSRALSQGTPAPGSAEPDDEASAPGSAALLVAPKDAKARDKWLQKQLDAAIAARPRLAGALITADVVDLSTGAELYAHDADRPMNLASNTKLLTSMAALGTLGGGFRWRTAVYVDDLDDATGDVKGDLYVRGRGDPTLSADDLRALADDIAARGVRHVAGRLVIDGSYFDGNVEPPHYADEPKERAGFRAPVASFGIERGTVTVTVIGNPGGKATVRLVPDAPAYVRIAKADVATVTDKRTRIKLDVKPAHGRLEFDVTGQIRPSEGSWSARERVDDPARLAAEVLRVALAARGVTIAHHGATSGTVPATALLVATHDSVPLTDVLREMNKHSDNYIAESLLKTVGAESRAAGAAPAPATWADGVAAVHKYLATIGLPDGSYRADNGSGLFGASAVSAHQIVKLLRAADADYRIGPDLVASLPVGGLDGTLARRWHGRPALGRVRAKTGTLDQVVTLSGFVGVGSRHVLAFSILVNAIPRGERGVSRAMADDMADAMVAYLEP